MAVFDLHEATIADEMRKGARFIVHSIVIDTEDANVFGKRGEAAGAAEEAIGGDGDRRHGRDEPYELRASGGASAAAIDTLFVTILDGVRARGNQANARFAYATLAIIRGGTISVIGTFAAFGAAAIETCFIAILDHVGARGSRAGSARTNAALALRRVGADFPIDARRATDRSAIDIAFARIFGAIGAFHVDARVHLANERARTALHAIETRHTRAIAIANAAKAIGLRAERSLRNGVMREDAIGAHVGGAFFGIVVRVVGGHGGNIERGVALLYFAITIELRRQCRTRRSQSLAIAFAIGAFWCTAEIDGTIVLAIGGDRAFGHAAAAAATAPCPAIST